MGSNSEKVGKAVQFLAFPDIREISSDVTKAKFLKSQGLNHDEVKEAFIRHYVASGTNTSQIPVSSIQLNPVSGDYNGTVAEVQHTQNDSPLSKFFSFCQKLVLFAGIVSSFYYAYQKWAGGKDAKRKSEKAMKDEIIQLRNEITRLSSELRHHQLLQRNNANVLSEITSLKAIVVGRQQFQEKQNGKVSVLPTWQTSESDSTECQIPSTNSSQLDEIVTEESVSSCSANTSVDSNTITKTESSIPAIVSQPSENDVCSSEKTQIKNKQQKSNSNGVEELKKNVEKSNDVENVQKSNDVENVKKSNNVENVQESKNVENVQKSKDVENVQKSNPAIDVQKSKAAKNEQKSKKSEKKN